MAKGKFPNFVGAMGKFDSEMGKMKPAGKPTTPSFKGKGAKKKSKQSKDKMC